MQPRVCCYVLVATWDEPPADVNSLGSAPSPHRQRAGRCEKSSNSCNLRGHMQKRLPINLPILAESYFNWRGPVGRKDVNQFHCPVEKAPRDFQHSHVPPAIPHRMLHAAFRRQRRRTAEEQLRLHWPKVFLVFAQVPAGSVRQLMGEHQDLKAVSHQDRTA